MWWLTRKKGESPQDHHWRQHRVKWQEVKTRHEEDEWEKQTCQPFPYQKFIEEKYEEDKQHIIDKYNELGYRDAQIVVDSVSPYDDRTVDVYMKIEEGDKYYLRNVTWVGNTIYASDWLNEQLRMKREMFITRN